MRGRSAWITVAMSVALTVSATGCSSSAKPASNTGPTCPAGNAKPSRSVPWSSVYANVYNASGTSGKAAEIATQLTWRGLHTLQVENDPLSADRSAPKNAEIRFGPAGKTIALNIAAQIPHAALYEDKRADPTVDIVIGKDFSLLPRPVSAINTVDVVVYNTTVVGGLAGSVTKTLSDEGFKASTQPNDGSYYPDDEAVIVYNDEGLPQAQRLAMSFTKARLVKASDAPHSTIKGTQVHLYLGSKWPVDNAKVLPLAQATNAPSGAVVKPAC